jgi:hypothetical protein
MGDERRLASVRISGDEEIREKILDLLIDAEGLITVVRMTDLPSTELLHIYLEEDEE